MTIDRRHLGETSEPRVVDVEKGFLIFFAKVTGETDPIYFDEEAARAAGHPAIPAPPTYLYSLSLAARAGRGGLLDARGGMGLDARKLVHGEQGFTYHRPIHAGDRLTLTTTTTGIYEKKGGALEFVVQETRATGPDGALRAEMRIVTVVRHG